MKTFKLIQQMREYNVNNTVVSKLYNAILKNELDENNSTFIGEISIDKTYIEYVNKINSIYPALVINSNDYYIYFKDKKIEQALLNINIGDGVGITQLNASDTILPAGLFRSEWNTNNPVGQSIEYFNEFKYFKGVIWNNGSDLRCEPFYKCINLKEITFPDGWGYAVNCGNMCFSSCTSLKYVSLPASINFLGWAFFADCPIETLIFRGSNPPEVRSTASLRTEAIIYVPDGSENLYSATFPNNVIKPISEYTE